MGLLQVLQVTLMHAWVGYLLVSCSCFQSWLHVGITWLFQALVRGPSLGQLRQAPWGWDQHLWVFGVPQVIPTEPMSSPLV